MTDTRKLAEEYAEAIESHCVDNAGCSTKFLNNALTEFARLVREECAQVCDRLAATNRAEISDEWWHAQGECAAAIRALSAKGESDGN